MYYHSWAKETVQAWRATFDPQHPCQKAGHSGAHLQSQGQGSRDRRISRTYCIGKRAYQYLQVISSMRGWISKSNVEHNGGRWWMTISSLHVIVRACTHAQTHMSTHTRTRTCVHTHELTHTHERAHMHAP